jgi:hypothetical protein
MKITLDEIPGRIAEAERVMSVLSITRPGSPDHRKLSGKLEIERQDLTYVRKEIEAVLDRGLHTIPKGGMNEGATPEADKQWAYWKKSLNRHERISEVLPEVDAALGNG